MKKKKNTDKPKIQKLPEHEQVKKPVDPEEPLNVPEDDPDIIPEDDPYENSPASEQPPPGEGP